MNIVTTTCVLPLGKLPVAWDRGVRVEGGNLFDTDYDLTILLRNLAVAGALCAAFGDGWAARDDYEHADYKEWHPGCGREVPR